jgi:hypothetical protein
MKIFNNLPGALRVLFRFLRVMTIIFAVFWSIVLVYNTWIQKRFGHDAKLMVTVGEIALPVARGVFDLSSNTATTGSLALESMRGKLQVDLASQDTALTSAVRQAIIPSMVALIVFCYLMFSSLACVCANLERGEAFNAQNLCLVRRIGGYLIFYSLVGAGLEHWASFVLAGYFDQHVVLTGLATTMPFTGRSGALQFGLIPGMFTAQGGFLLGLLVLVVAEAFRQGLNLKAENDLTV